MKILFDLFPIALFFIAYKLTDIYIATVVAIVASLVQVGYARISSGKFETMHLVSLALIVVLGTMTLVLQDERFIKWKPTLVNWAFCLAILSYTLYKKEPAIAKVLGSKIELPNAVWNNLNWAWALFFAFSGLINLWVAFEFSTETWVNFKLFGLMGLTLFFALAQGLYIAKYLPQPND